MKLLGSALSWVVIIPTGQGMCQLNKRSSGDGGREAAADSCSSLSLCVAMNSILQIKKPICMALKISI